MLNATKIRQTRSLEVVHDSGLTDVEVVEGSSTKEGYVWFDLTRAIISLCGTVKFLSESCVVKSCFGSDFLPQTQVETQSVKETIHLSGIETHSSFQSSYERGSIGAPLR